MSKVLWYLGLVIPALLGSRVWQTLPTLAVSERSTVNSVTNSALQSATDEVTSKSMSDTANAATNQSLLSSPGTTTAQTLSQSIAVDRSNSLNLSDPLLGQTDTSSNQNGLAQVTSVSQLSDVQPTDWAFQALQSLVERYGCIAGYPDSTYRGNRALTRYEFAAGLNACLDRISELIAQTTADLATKEDLATLQRLQEEFAQELATLRGRVDALEARTTELEANQFSTTTKLTGDAYFTVSDLFGDTVGDQNNTVFQYRSRLIFDTSFTGNDRLRAILQSGNVQLFTQPGNEARLAGEANTSNNVVISDLSYGFPISESIRGLVFANGAGLDSFTFGNTISPLDVAAARGSFTRFGQRPPIYRIANVTAGAGVNFLFNRNLSLQLAYAAGEPSNPGTGAGLFNGNYGIIGQLTARNLFNNRLDLGLTYVNSYTGTAPGTTPGSVTAGARTGTGSLLAAVDIDRPVSANSYGVTANFKISSGFQLGGWVGYSNVRAIGVGDGDVWNYAVTLAFPDLGGKGNLGGIVVGVEPRLAGATPALATALGRRSDPNAGLHVEGFYRLALNDNIDIMPGLLWLTAPNHDDSNDDIFLGVIRTTFRF